MTEHELTQKTLGWLNSEFTAFQFEFQNFQLSIDLLGIRNDGKLIAIEYKLKAWKKAIKQAKKHRINVDFCYILLPKLSRKALNKALLYAREYGVGIYLYDIETNHVELFLQAKQTEKKIDFRYEKYKEEVQKTYNCPHCGEKSQNSSWFLFFQEHIKHCKKNSVTRG